MLVCHQGVPHRQVIRGLHAFKPQSLRGTNPIRYIGRGTGSGSKRALGRRPQIPGDSSFVGSLQYLQNRAHPQLEVFAVQISPSSAPTSCSWLNLIECWFAPTTDNQIWRGTHRTTKELEATIESYLEIYNEDPKPLYGLNPQINPRIHQDLLYAD